MKLIELKEEKLWMDRLVAKQVEYLFFTIDLKNAEERVNFDIAMDGNDVLNVTFMNCLEKTVLACKNDIYKK